MKMEKTSNKFDTGDTVLFRLGMADGEHAPRGLKRWDGCRFTVKKKIYMNGLWVYELKSCNSPCGTAYTILEEWLTKVD